MLRRYTFLGAGALAAFTFGGREARAQDAPDVALNQYEHPMAGDAFFGVPSPAIGGHLEPRALITFDYAKDPLVLVDADGNDVATPVTSQMYLHFGASFALWDRLMISLDFPLAINQTGEDSILGGAVLQGASGVAPGDLRIGLRGRIFGGYWDPFQIGVGGYLYVPTGGTDSYASDGKFYGQPHLLIGGRAPYFVYSLKAGAFIRGADNPHNFTYGVGVATSLLDDTLMIGPELLGSVNLNSVDLVEGAIERKGTVNTELHLGVQYRLFDVLGLGVAGGPGLSNGVGTPQYRILARLTYDPRPPKEEEPKDTDGDGIMDAQDACPKVPGVPSNDPAKHGCPPPPDTDGDGILDEVDACPEVKGVPNDDPEKHGCPPPGDRDGDGIVDEQDACPDTPGVGSDDPAKNGCPPDRDGDGIIDDKDACPDVPGVASEDPAKNGCPPDRDGDGIIDSEDACPDTPGPKNEDPKKNGCPRVVVTDKEVLILQKVEFDLDKATIKPVSDSLLDEVAQTLKDHPELVELEVQGHTDDQGPAFYNKNLSQKRSEAVKAALVKRGIEAGRLVPKGYGEDVPIADNSTPEGRATNRRVQFKITKKDDSKKKPKAP
ncbi:MAG: OmpA family protein [Polyangiaceae bacterium]